MEQLVISNIEDLESALDSIIDNINDVMQDGVKLKTSSYHRLLSESRMGSPNTALQ